MTKKKKQTPIIETEAVKPAETIVKHWQSFKVKKEFPTDEQVYKVGETFRHYDKRVINFLKSKNII